MLVYVNNTSVHIFTGATAIDAVRRYCTDTNTPVPQSELYDAWGNVIAPDSPMADGRHIFTSSPR
ncbi:MAG: hypothetical protein IJN29_06940 [Akkermansia sp.]|nr:hypothetical protein [Akkermansia sp.]